MAGACGHDLVGGHAAGPRQRDGRSEAEQQVLESAFPEQTDGAGLVDSRFEDRVDGVVVRRIFWFLVFGGSECVLVKTCW